MTRAELSMTDWVLRGTAQPAIVPESIALDETGRGEQAYRVAKGVADLVLSLALVVFSAPIMLVVAIAIKLTSPGPVFFRQLRAGRHGRPFTMYKFRSMVMGAEEWRTDLDGLNEIDGPVFKLRQDPRLTRVGRILRRTSIDELPQLFNVLRGDMTLVGPRPLPLNEVMTGSPAERRRLEVTPGLTCLWQISGRCDVPYSEWMQLDLLYIENRSFKLDLQILLRTIPAVLSCRGAY